MDRGHAYVHACNWCTLAIGSGRFNCELAGARKDRIRPGLRIFILLELAIGQNVVAEKNNRSVRPSPCKCSRRGGVACQLQTMKIQCPARWHGQPIASLSLSRRRGRRQLAKFGHTACICRHRTRARVHVRIRARACLQLPAAACTLERAEDNFSAVYNCI